jgi:hypothetical protein
MGQIQDENRFVLHNNQDLFGRLGLPCSMVHFKPFCKVVFSTLNA